MVGTALNNGDKLFDAIASLKRWGNSQGIRLPKELIEKIGLNENDEVGINVEKGKIVIEKIHNPKYSSLQDRLEAFYNKPIDEIFVENTEEIATGKPVGNEVW